MGTDKISDTRNLIFRNKGTLNADRFLQALWIEQHVSLSEKLFGSNHIDDRTGIHAGGYREGDSGGHVRLDEARDHVRGGALRGHDEVDAGRARELRDAAQSDLAARGIDMELHELSMGMSNDYSEGIGEGATMVRIGRAIFSADYAG